MADGGVVFDLFHTLVDPEPMKPHGFRRTAAIAEAAAVAHDPFERFWRDTYVERETSTIDLVDLVERHALETREPFDADERAELDRLLGLGMVEAIAQPDPAIVELVAELSDAMPVGVLSNCHEREMRDWDESPLAAHVHVVARSCRIGAMKPDPVVYRWIIDRLDIDPAMSTYVGNGADDELPGARRAGFRRVVHANLYDRAAGVIPLDEQRRRADQADASVDTVDELRMALGLRVA